MNDKTIISYLLGDIATTEERKLVDAQLSETPELQQRLEELRRSLNTIQLLPCDDVKQSIVIALLKSAKAEVDGDSAPIIRLPGFASRLAAAAAAIAIAGLIGFGAMFMPEPNDSLVATANGQAIHNADVIESNIGETREIKLNGGGTVLLDGASAIQIFEQGEFAPPRIEVLHGRAIVTATGDAPVIVTAWQRRIDVLGGSKAAISYDRPFAHVSDNQAIIRSQTISDVVALAYKVGVKIDASGIPEKILQRRVSFFGRDLDSSKFASTFLTSVRTFGVTGVESGNKIQLVYQGASSTSDGVEARSLEIAALEGQVLVKGSNKTKSISSDTINFLAEYTLKDSVHEQRSETGYRDMVVWAGLDDGATEAKGSRLPSGTVIHLDKLVVFDDGSERIFKLDGAEYIFPLPDGQSGRVIGLMSSGAEFEYKEGDKVKRVFIPFSKLK